MDDDILKLYQQNISMNRAILLMAILIAASAVKIDNYLLADPMQCIQDKCPNQYAACQKDPKCQPALEDCYKKCGSKSSCWTFCLPGKGSQAAIDTAKCASANGCVGSVPSTALTISAPIDCIETHCKSQLQTCSKDAKCFPAMQDCEKQCGNNTSCYTTCLAGKGNANATNLWKCIIDNNCINAVTAVAIADPQQCIEEKCPTQWAACLKDPKCKPALDDCEKKCGTKASCWTLCLPGKGSQAAIDVAKCAQAQGCDKAATQLSLAGPEECIMTHCKSQEQACVNDRRCIQVMDECDSQCNTNFTCWNNCLSRRGNKNASDYFKCIIDNQCYKSVVEVSTAVVLADPMQCIQDKCPNQYAACQKDPKCQPALEDCYKKCGSKSSCWTFCLPGKGSQAAIDTAKCASANGCVGSVPEETRLVLSVLNTPEECVMDHCKDQLVACFQDSKCLPALQDCEKECADNVACWNTCVPKKGSTAAANYWKCIVDNDCINAVSKVLKSTAVALADPQQCIEEKCPTQWAACLKDPKCKPALDDCEKKCGTKASCWTLCLPGKGSQAAIDVAKCAQAQGCDKAKEEVSTAVVLADPMQCIQDKCPNQYAACQKDPKCQPALEDCYKKCGSKSSCWTFCLPGKGSQAAIDTAKCASANGCVGATPFESCMVRSCSSEHDACMDNWSCRKSLRKCLTGNAIFDFEHECLLAESKVTGFLSEWYHCAGNHFCI